MINLGFSEISHTAEPSADGVRPRDTITLTVSPKTLNRVDPLLFGQFLERASFGEPGPEGVIDPHTATVRDDVVAIARDMQIPLIRFPGGTDVDYTDWRDLVDDAAAPGPRRKELIGVTDKPIGTRFGIDEYFNFRDNLGQHIQTILVVNLRDALIGQCPPEEAAQRAAGLIAYVNAPVGHSLPEGMPDWPGLRARHGHPLPRKAEFVQIGNEAWAFSHSVAESLGQSPAEKSQRVLIDWYLKCIHAYIAAIRRVDPDVGIILDGDLGTSVDSDILADPILRKEIAFLALHTYGPGPLGQVARGEIKVSPDQLTADEWWWIWVSALGDHDAAGQNIALGKPAHILHEKFGYRIACTEWNWNGWGFERFKKSPSEYRLAGALGVASFLNGMIRQGEIVGLATQSLLIGSNWEIAAIFAKDSASSPQQSITGIITTLYHRNHGSTRLETTVSGSVRIIEQPYTLGWGKAAQIANIDAVTTIGDGRLYVHVVNNEPHRLLPCILDLTAVSQGPALAHLTRIRRADDKSDIVEEHSAAEQQQGLIFLDLPPASVTIIEIVGDFNPALWLDNQK